jgi:hypothetical protein
MSQQDSIYCRANRNRADSINCHHLSSSSTGQLHHRFVDGIGIHAAIVSDGTYTISYDKGIPSSRFDLFHFCARHGCYIFSSMHAWDLATSRSSLDSHVANDHWSNLVDGPTHSQRSARYDKWNECRLLPWAHEALVDIHRSDALFTFVLVLLGENTSCRAWDVWIGSIWAHFAPDVSSNASQSRHRVSAKLEQWLETTISVSTGVLAMDGLFDGQENNTGYNPGCSNQGILFDTGILPDNATPIGNRAAFRSATSRRQQKLALAPKHTSSHCLSGMPSCFGGI